MYLTKTEEAMLSGEYGYGAKLAMEIIEKLGSYYNADNTIEIKNVQVSGISYKNLGEYGIDLLRKFNDSKFRVPTYLNPIGFDMERPEEFTTDMNFINGQREIINIFQTLGANLSLTCTPYYIIDPGLNDHLAWAESSAIVYANSVLGARTNRESGISALAAAIVGRTANYGLHLDNGRKATIKVTLDFKPQFFDYAPIGLYLGSMIKNGRPYFTNLENNRDALKSLGAALNASGSIPMFHAENITPEFKNAIIDNIENIKIGKRDINSFLNNINKDIDVDVVMLGCPHLSEEEIKNIALLVKNKTVKRNKRLILFTSRKVFKENEEYINLIKRSGADVYTDTCMVVSPIQEKFSVIGLNSGKATYYVGKEKRVILMDMKSLMELVLDEN